MIWLVILFQTCDTLKLIRTKIRGKLKNIKYLDYTIGLSIPKPSAIQDQFILK